MRTYLKPFVFAQDSPTAFGGTYAKESQLSDEDWLNRTRQCTTDTHIGYLAIDTGVPCGLIRATPDDKNSSVAWVESMWIAPSHRKRGIGRLLIDAILAWAR